MHNKHQFSEFTRRLVAALSTSHGKASHIAGILVRLNHSTGSSSSSWHRLLVLSAAADWRQHERGLAKCGYIGKGKPTLLFEPLFYRRATSRPSAELNWNILELLRFTGQTPESSHGRGTSAGNVNFVGGVVRITVN